MTSFWFPGNTTQGHTCSPGKEPCPGLNAQQSRGTHRVGSGSAVGGDRLDAAAAGAPAGTLETGRDDDSAIARVREVRSRDERPVTWF